MPGCFPGRTSSSKTCIASVIRAILYFSFALSIPYLLLQIVPIYAIMQAYGFDAVSWAQAGALMVLLRLGGVFPRLRVISVCFRLFPLWCLPCSVAPVAMARRFAFILFAVVTMPLLIVGFIALIASGAKMGEIQREAQAEMRARQDELAKS